MLILQCQNLRRAHLLNDVFAKWPNVVHAEFAAESAVRLADVGQVQQAGGDEENQ